MMIKMWHFIIFVCVIPWTNSQIDRTPDNGKGWNIKLNVPGEPGNDYPTLNAIPRTTFTCAGREPGYYADQQTNCQVFRVCTAGATFNYESFLCPNGTLFNQAVFVCDWWMNVNCEKSQEVLNRNNYERFGNLKLGPQLMTDVRKMITHPMRNPYNTGFLRNNFVMTQEYKPPLEGLYPKGALINSQEINTNNIYVPNKGIYRNFGQHLANDIGFAASSASPQYIKTNQNTQRTQFSNTQRTQNSQMTQVYPNSHIEYRKKLESSQNSNVQRQVFAQYNQNSKAPYLNSEKLTKFEFNKINQAKLPLKQSLYQTQFNSNKNIGPINAEAKQNLVSTEASPTIISKTIAFKSTLPGNKPGSPKSRITFKTWILKPKNAKLIVEPISYNKNLIQSASEQVLSTSIPYVYEKPKQSLDLTSQNSGYFYNQPVIEKQITNSPKSSLYDSPTTFRPQIPSRLYLTPTPDVQTTTASPPNEISTLKTLENTYLPPIETEQLSRQYLSPLIKSQQYKQNGLTASSSQIPQYEVIKPKNNRLPNLTETKQSHINTNHNNLSFTDVLTKEQLTINDNVQYTNKIVKSSLPFKKLTHYSNNYNTLEGNDLNVENETERKEELTSKFPVSPTKSSKLILPPSTDLEPPFESDINYLSSNKLSNLPYYKEPVNTIERTVSIKITLPEKIANILFRNESNLDDLEVLNTGSSNYLVYANNLATQPKIDLTPIGKLSLIKHSNVSNSQDLVFSFLADSLNAAKEYNNIAKQNILSSSTPPLQNYNNAEEITSKISQLTSSQFTNNNFNGYQNNQKYTAPSQTSKQNKESTQFTSNVQQNEYQQQIPQQMSTHLQPIIQNQLQSVRVQDSNNRYFNQPQNSNQIYSGQLYQLPVPDVTRDYYNSPNSKLFNNQRTQKTITIPHNTQGSTGSGNYFQKRPDIEIIPSQQLPFSRYQQTSFNQETLRQQNDQPGHFKNIINSENGITAQVQDSIVGTIAHPLSDNQLLTYKKDQSYQIFSQLNSNDHENNQINDDKTNSNLQSQNSNSNSFEFIPSVAYKLSNEKEQERLLNTFNINEFGEPNKDVNSHRQSNRQHISTNVNYSINHPSNYGERLNNRAVSGQSSYIPRQNQPFTNNKNARIEDLDSDEPNGYAKISPKPKFIT